ncbi:MAG: transcriptional regulator [Alphaproteobacteria bacterium]|nr:transcriptional regulator [Alphaproteobacteria bacterium]
MMLRMSRTYRVKVPEQVRQRLGLRPGDFLRYRVVGKRVALERVEADDRLEDPFTSFGEWAGEADRKAYAGL